MSEKQEIVVKDEPDIGIINQITQYLEKVIVASERGYKETGYEFHKGEHKAYSDILGRLKELAAPDEINQQKESTISDKEKDVAEIKKLAMILGISEARANYFKNAAKFVDKEPLQKLDEHGFTVVPHYEFISMATLHYIVTHKIIALSNDLAHEILKNQ